MYILYYMYIYIIIYMVLMQIFASTIPMIDCNSLIMFDLTVCLATEGFAAISLIQSPIFVCNDLLVDASPTFKS